MSGVSTQTSKHDDPLVLNTKSLTPILIFLALIIGIFMGVLGGNVFGFFDRALSGDNDLPTTEVEVSGVDGSDYYDEEYVNEILSIFQQRYIKDLENYSSDDLTYGAIKGLISSLDDQYTVFLTPEEASEYLEDRSSDFEGIGVTLGFEGGYSYVESVLRDHPAEKEGILPRDIILEVDGEDVAGKYPTEVAGLIRGEGGTEVKLKVVRAKDGNNEALEFEIIRSKIEIDNVSWEELEDGIVKINIVQFSDESIEKFNSAWDRVVTEIEEEVGSPKGIIVDVRNNPGGFVSSVQYVLEEFLENGEIIMQEKANDSDAVIYKDKREGAFEDIDIIVLVNEGSASASEIFASAITENNKGEIVGKPTVGKGVEQELLELSDGSILLIVFQQWLTPKGNEISHDNPIKPDYDVDFEIEDFEKGEDPQLDKALELLD